MTILRLQNIEQDDLHIGSFEIHRSEAWCFYGSNRSGISTLIRLLSGEPIVDGCIHVEGAVFVLSFAKQQEIYEEELRRDESDYLDRLDPGTPARRFIRHPQQYHRLIKDFELETCLDKGYRQLSSGESRKVMLIAAISADPDLLVMESPYDGLDQLSCRELDTLLATLHHHGHPVMITVSNPGDIPEWCTHICCMEDGKITRRGKREEVLYWLSTNASTSHSSLQLQLPEEQQRTIAEELVRLEDGCARYGDFTVFEDLQVSIHTGEHTLITGPNGSGKSTLLNIITGDNQNCYANTLSIFGKRRGSGESIWDIKKEMGIVSPELHRNHYIPGSALQVVLSGFFDSIGVYSRFSHSQKATAREWLAMVGLARKAQSPFRRLSYAEQRLCLIARGLIKMPKLLILDEPTQGLDQQNREDLLDFLERLAKRKASTIVYASHRTDEFRPFFQQHIDMGSP